MNQLDPIQILGIIAFAVFLIWLFLFFSFLRDRMMRAIGGWLDVSVHEEMGLAAGTYTTSGQNVPIAKTGAIWLADVIVTILGTVGVCALISVPGFLLAESGSLDSLNTLVGRSVTLTAPPAVEMSVSQRAFKLELSARNQGRETEKQCIIGITDYKAENGYLSGNSAYFDLAPGAEQRITLAVDAQRPRVGTFDMRVKIECGNRRLNLQTITLRVKP